VKSTTQVALTVERIFVTSVLLRRPTSALGLVAALGTLLASPCLAQTPLSVQEAVDTALRSRPDLKASNEAIAAAEGRQHQAGLWANPDFQFSNENLRRGQHYLQDVDTQAVVTQRLDVLGKRDARVAAAADNVEHTRAEAELSRRIVVRDVKLAYWTARGAQETRDLLRASVANLRQIVDYHTAQLSVGLVSEQDVLRVRLESERVQIAANLAQIAASRSRVRLLQEMGQMEMRDLTLVDALDSRRTPLQGVTIEQVLAERIEMKAANAALDEARSNARLQSALARPDLEVIYGYKRTQLPNTNFGSNTSVAGFIVSLPLLNRNQGNRAASQAEVRRQEQLVADTAMDVRADFEMARQEFELRQTELIETLLPLREHAVEISTIAQGAYAQGGADLLRLIDAQRSRIDAELAWVQGMVEYQQSVANLEAAEGVAP
jgi:cobalt-zinc-cadmium efflux system outer membrane protein